MNPAEVKREISSLAKRYPKRGIDPTIPEGVREQLVERERMKALEEGENYMKKNRYAKGGSVRGGGCEQRGKTRGKVV